MKKKMYKLFLTLMVSLPLGSGPLAQNEIHRSFETFSGTGDTQVQVLDEVEREKELEEIRKKRFPNFFRDIHNS